MVNSRCTLYSGIACSSAYLFGDKRRDVKCNLLQITYISVEHPKVDYMNTKYLVYANLTAERFSRSNPVYYVGLHFHHLIPWGSNIYIDVYFYELLSNQYKRSFVEMHFDWCYLVEKDLFFGAAVRAGGWKGGCPHAP
ncbi:hypothetical protein SFRURICE_005995, partial [Spodoptera frugiperda]